MAGGLEGQLALVTGASRGIGAATAEALAAAGAHVILTARTAKGLEAVEDRIHASGGSATIAPLDLTEAESIGRLAVAISGRWEALDILVLNAAMLGTLAPVPHFDAKEFAQVLTLNIGAQQALIAAFDPMLQKSANARVIGLTSSVAASPRAFWGGYGASKAAFETLLGAYGEETRNIGRVKVAIIDPGATRTEMRARAFPGEDAATLKGPEVVGARIAALAVNGFETGWRERVG
jgi:short-subunit dehydrogenase